MESSRCKGSLACDRRGAGDPVLALRRAPPLLVLRRAPPEAGAPGSWPRLPPILHGVRTRAGRRRVHSCMARCAGCGGPGCGQRAAGLSQRGPDRVSEGFFLKGNWPTFFFLVDFNDSILVSCGVSPRCAECADALKPGGCAGCALRALKPRGGRS
jgi:hypothetical protein